MGRNTKRRLVFYSSLVLGIAGFLAFTMVMPGQSYHGPLVPLDDAQKKLAVELRTDVEALAGPTSPQLKIAGDGERNMSTKGSLERGATLIEAAFAKTELVPKRLPYPVDGQTVVNLEATIEGGAKKSEIVVVGAHYDSVILAPGADDNASGVAGVLALARIFAHEHPARTLRFVAFANEEPPHFWQPTMGSLVYAKECKARGDDVVAMLSLESIGYFRDGRGTQKYPPVVSWFYPDTGDFIAFVGNVGSRSLVRQAIGTFRANAKFPTEGAAMPGFVTGVGWSDQWSFWQVGYRGVMITDTAPFRNPSYHTPSDRPDTLDYDRLARIVVGLTPVVRALVD